MIEAIRELVRETCAAETNASGYAAWTHHIVVVVENSLKLAEKLGADKEVVELAALLHDYASVLNVEWVEEHHLHGAKLAEEILQRYNYPEEKLDNVVHAIAAHRSSRKFPRVTIEAKIVASSDAMAHIQMAYEMLHYAYAIKKMSPDEGAEWVLAKITRDWRKLIPEAKEMVKEQYEAARVVLNARPKSNGRVS